MLVYDPFRDGLLPPNRRRNPKGRGLGLARQFGWAWINILFDGLNCFLNLLGGVRGQESVAKNSIGNHIRNSVPSKSASNTPLSPPPPLHWNPSTTPSRMKLSCQAEGTPSLLALQALYRTVRVFVSQHMHVDQFRLGSGPYALLVRNRYCINPVEIHDRRAKRWRWEWRVHNQNDHPPCVRSWMLR